MGLCVDIDIYIYIHIVNCSNQATSKPWTEEEHLWEEDDEDEDDVWEDMWNDEESWEPEGNFQETALTEDF